MSEGTRCCRLCETLLCLPRVRLCPTCSARQRSDRQIVKARLRTERERRQRAEAAEIYAQWTPDERRWGGHRAERALHVARAGEDLRLLRARRRSARLRHERDAARPGGARVDWEDLLPWLVLGADTQRVRWSARMTMRQAACAHATGDASLGLVLRQGFAAYLDRCAHLDRAERALVRAARAAYRRLAETSPSWAWALEQGPGQGRSTYELACDASVSERTIQRWCRWGRDQMAAWIEEDVCPAPEAQMRA